MIAFVLWLWLLAHAGIGSALADDTPSGCSTDTECNCTLDCLDGVAFEENDDA